MQSRYFFAKLKGAEDISGIVLPDLEDRAANLQKAAELLTVVHGRVVTGSEIELAPYFPSEKERIRLGRT